MTDTIQNLTYDDFGHIIGNNRSGTAADMSYAYDNLHGWTKKIKSAGGGFDKRFNDKRYTMIRQIDSTNNIQRTT